MPSWEASGEDFDTAALPLAIPAYVQTVTAKGLDVVATSDGVYLLFWDLPPFAAGGCVAADQSTVHPTERVLVDQVFIPTSRICSVRRQFAGNKDWRTVQ